MDGPGKSIDSMPDLHNNTEAKNSSSQVGEFKGRLVKAHDYGGFFKKVEDQTSKKSSKAMFERKIEVIHKYNESNSVKQTSVSEEKVDDADVILFSHLKNPDGSYKGISLLVDKNTNQMHAAEGFHWGDGSFINPAIAHGRVDSGFDIIASIPQHENLVKVDVKNKWMEKSGAVLQDVLFPSLINKSGNMQKVQSTQKALSKGLIKHVQYSLLSGLAHLHTPRSRDLNSPINSEQGFAHRNITPKSILIDEANGHVRLAGFEHAVAADQNINIVGSPEYHSPELSGGTFEGANPISKYSGTNKACDSWAAGVTLYELLSEEPFLKHDVTSNDRNNIVARAYGYESINKLHDVISKKPFFESKSAKNERLRCSTVKDEGSRQEAVKFFVSSKINSLKEKLISEEPNRFSEEEVDSITNYLTETLEYNAKERLSVEDALKLPLFSDAKSSSFPHYSP